MQVYFSDKANADIKNFFDFYRDLYLRLYDDTWLWPTEEYIKNSYCESAMLMRDAVYIEIEALFFQEKIFGYVPWNDESDIRLITKKYWNYRLFIEYRETSDYRIIKGVRIYKK